MPPVNIAVKIWQPQLECACRQQSEEFHQVLQACSVPTQHHVYHDRSHAGFVIDWTGPPSSSQVQINVLPPVHTCQSMSPCIWTCFSKHAGSEPLSIMRHNAEPWS